MKKECVLYDRDCINCGECDEMFSSACIVREFNWITEVMNENFSAGVKLRYRQPDQECMVEIVDKSTIKLVFKTKQRAVTIGQFAVLYDEKGKCFGGGRIDELIR